jgi:hypothetical protein
VQRLSYVLVLGMVVVSWAAPGWAQAVAAAPAAPAATEPTPPPAAQDHAPRVYALSLGASYLFSSRLPLSESGRDPHMFGVQVGTRLGWQVRGLAGGDPASVGFELDFLAQPSAQVRDSYAMIYGVFAKHAFLSRLRTHPFISYGLGAAQVWVSEVDGRGIGHATRLTFGVDIGMRERLQLSVALSYQGIFMPNFGFEDRPARNTNFHGCVVSTGVWFGR